MAMVVVFGAFAGCTSGDDASTQVTQETTARSMPAGQDRILPEGDEPDVFGPLDETDAEFETENGRVQIGSAEVPDAVADSFPIPDGLQIQLSSEVGTQAGFSAVTDMTVEELVTFYESQLAAAGYEATRRPFVDDAVAVFDFDGADGAGQLVISSAPGGGRSVLVTFSS